MKRANKNNLELVAREINNTFISLEKQLENLGDDVIWERLRILQMQTEFSMILQSYKEKANMEMVA
jgi:hypothetical protein